MTKLLQSQILQRWDELSDELRETLVSEMTSDFIWKTCQKEFLSEEKIYVVAKITGSVLMGFIHPKDFAEEIKKTLNVDSRIAKPIAEAIDQRIFEPLKEELAKFHTPSATDINNIEIATAPVRISIDGTSEAPKIISGTTFTATPGSQKNVIIGPKVTTAVKPIPADITPAKPVTPLAGDIGKPIPHFEQRSNVGGAMAAPTPTAQKPKSTGEFARLASQSTNTPNSTPATPITPAPAVKPMTPVAPKPVMLQSNSLPKPIQNAPNLNNPQKAVDILAGKKIPVPLPMKPTVIEIGGAAKTGSPTPTPTSTPIAPIKPFTPNTTPNNTAGRQITEMTSQTAPAILAKTPTPMPSKPPAPPMPSITPKPQMPVSFQKPAPMPLTAQPIQPQPQQKPAGLAPIIVKNFTEGEK